MQVLSIQRLPVSWHQSLGGMAYVVPSVAPIGDII